MWSLVCAARKDFSPRSRRYRSSGAIDASSRARWTVHNHKKDLEGDLAPKWLPRRMLDAVRLKRELHNINCGTDIDSVPTLECVYRHLESFRSHFSLLTLTHFLLGTGGIGTERIAEEAASNWTVSVVSFDNLLKSCTVVLNWSIPFLIAFLPCRYHGYTNLPRDAGFGIMPRLSGTTLPPRQKYVNNFSTNL